MWRKCRGNTYSWSQSFREVQGDEIPHGKECFCDESPQNDLRIYIKIVPQGSFEPNDLYSGKALISCSTHTCACRSTSLLLHLHIGLPLSSERAERIFNTANDCAQRW